jgi:hypothetical protein
MNKSNSKRNVVELATAFVGALEEVRAAEAKHEDMLEGLRQHFPTFNDEQLVNIATVIVGGIIAGEDEDADLEAAAKRSRAKKTPAKPAKPVEKKAKRTRVRRLKAITKRGDALLMREVLAKIVDGKPLSFEAIVKEFNRRGWKTNTKSGRSNAEIIRATLNNFSKMFSRRLDAKNPKKTYYSLIKKAERKPAAAAATKPAKVIKVKGKAASMYTILEKIREQFASEEFILNEVAASLKVPAKSLSVAMMGLHKRGQVKAVGVKCIPPKHVSQSAEV